MANMSYVQCAPGQMLMFQFGSDNCAYNLLPYGVARIPKYEIGCGGIAQPSFILILIFGTVQCNGVFLVYNPFLAISGFDIAVSKLTACVSDQ
jgi:hypothetical protein